MVRSYIAQYPILITDHGALHVIPWQASSIEHNFIFTGKKSAMLQLIREECSYTNIQKQL